MLLAFPRIFRAACSALLLAACADDDNTPPDKTSTVTAADFCDNDTRAPEYMPGREVFGQRIRAVLVESEPAPPRLGKTFLTVAFSDLSGAPLTDLSIQVRTWMPDHSHGSPSEGLIVTEPDAMGRPGHYTIGPIDFFMAQYWEVTLTTKRASDPTFHDAVLLNFCIGH